MPKHHPQSPDAHERWKPADQERYFIILGDGSVKNILWHSTPFDYGAWEFGNCFRLQSDAERAREAVKKLSDSPGFSGNRPLHSLSR